VLQFFKFRILSSWYRESLHKIFSRPVKRLQNAERIIGLTNFQKGVRSPSSVCKNTFSTFRRVHSGAMHHRTKFHCDSLKIARYHIWRVFFKLAAVRHLGLLEI